MAAVVTGGGSGIGAALALALSRRGVPVFIVGRRKDALEAVAARAPAGGAPITAVAADVTQAEGIAAVSAALSATRVRLLVHNAGVLGPIKPLAEIAPAEWRAVMSTNVDAPLFLTQALLPQMDAGARVLHVGSGAASSVIRGWGAYCVSKAGFRMLWRCLAEELRGHGVLVGSVRPGIIDTLMQEGIRSGAHEVFADKGFFVGLHAKKVEREGGAASGGAAAAAPRVSGPPPLDALDSPENAAVFLRWLLLDTPDKEFGKDEWDSREATHQARWAGVPLDA